MKEKHYYFDLNEEQLDEIQHTYALLKPLLDEHMNREEKKQHTEAVCRRLQISQRTLRRYLHHLREGGIHTLIRRKRSDAGKSDPPSRIYRRFEAEYPNQLWQGDARYDIPVPHPSKTGKGEMTYLFTWMDDFSGKIMGARYYWNEKLPCMEDCLRRTILRWGAPKKLYCDNGEADE